MESGRLLQLLWLLLRPPPEGVCVSMLRVLLLRCGGTGGGARCPSGTSCGYGMDTHKGGQNNNNARPNPWLVCEIKSPCFQNAFAIITITLIHSQ